VAIGVKCWRRAGSAQGLENLEPGHCASDWCVDCFVKRFGQDLCNLAKVEQFVKVVARCENVAQCEVRSELAKVSRNCGPVQIDGHKQLFFKLSQVELEMQNIARLLRESKLVGNSLPCQEQQNRKRKIEEVS
jgi:hypothetical protein